MRLLGGRQTKTVATFKLTMSQKWELILGPRGAGASQFTSDEERRAAWNANRAPLLAAVNLTTRPWGWWKYDAPEPRDHGDEEAQLRRLGLLRPDELEAIARWAADDARKRNDAGA